MTSHTPIDYVGLAAALLARAPELVARWLPHGVERNGRWYVGDFDGGEGESANVNLKTGQWIDNGGTDDDKGGDLISLYARIHNMSNAAAARELMEMLGWAREPRDNPPVGRSARAGKSGHGDKPAPGQRETPAGDEPPGADVRTPDKREAKWQPIVPVPHSAGRPSCRFGFRDTVRNIYVECDPARVWEYRIDGDLYGYVARYERISAKTGEVVKDTIAWTWCARSDGRGHQAWRAKTWDAPRPLYLPRGELAPAGSRPVLVVEGEKCAEEAQRILGDWCDVVSWPSGCKAWALARWSIIMGRKVYLWPDADAQRERLTKAEREAGTEPESKPFKPAHKQPGLQAMQHIGTLLQAEHGCEVLMCPLPEPGTLPDGWDVADAISQGWDVDRVRDFILRAVPHVPASDEARAKAATPPPAGASDEEDADAWRSKLIENGKGVALAVRENVVLALDGLLLPDGRHLPGIAEAQGVIAFNDFTNDVVKLRDPPWGGKAGVWEEGEELEVGNWLTRQHWLPPMGRQTLEEAVAMVARRHRHHPARDRIESMRGTWDGEKRLGAWLGRCCRKGPPLDDADPLQQYLARVGTWVFMAICARVINPGCKFDYMLILEGPQGMGKSTLSRLLGLDWHADTGLVLGDKDSYQNLQGVLVYEWGELDSLTRAEVTKVKSFVSSQKDRFRASFDRRPRDYPRQVVFIGTTNESHYLSDPTGNRRFWPVRVTRFIDLDWLRDNLAQLFAEALAYLDAGDRFHPTHKEQERLFDAQQLERTVENALESAIRRYLYDEDQKVLVGGRNGSLIDETTLADLLSALGISVDKQTNVLTKQASAALGRMGWERGRASGKGGKARPWVYRRPDESPPAPPAAAPAAGASESSTRPLQGTDDEAPDDDCPF